MHYFNGNDDLMMLLRANVILKPDIITTASNHIQHTTTTKTEKSVTFIFCFLFMCFYFIVAITRIMISPISCLF